MTLPKVDTFLELKYEKHLQVHVSKLHVYII